jgi:histidyl-tRNA synthetase
MSDNETLLNAPRGMRDFYPEDMALRNAIFDAWKTSARRFGFANYDACVVESLDLLKRKSGEEITEQIYTFTDKSGRELALRPEMTPTLARMVCARQGQLVFPLKWFTIAQCFRYERMTRGRKREHYQWNLDIIGENSIAAEAEVLATAIHALRQMGMQAGEFYVYFNNRALLGDILLQLGIPREHHAATFLALDKRGKIDDSEISALLLASGLSPDAATKVFSVLAIQSMDDAARLFSELPASYRDTIALLDMLKRYGVADFVKFDMSVIRGLTYYTGIVFEAFDAERKFRAIFGGGRYDNLLGDIGGKPQSAVGLGFGDVVVAEILMEKGTLRPGEGTATELAVGYMDEAQQTTAIAIASALRRKGRNVDLALAPERPKKFFGRCDKLHVAEVIYIGPDEAAGGVIKIKNMAGGTSTDVPISDLLA